MAIWDEVIIFSTSLTVATINAVKSKYIVRL